MSKNKELISVIVPVYNVEKYLRQCIDSIINQTYKSLEIILIDDGSTDNSGNICDEYAKKDDRIIVKHKENGGVSSARNLGLDIAKGQYIGFVDSDDYIEKDMYEYLYNNIKKERADISKCRGYWDFNNGIIKEFDKDKDEYIVLDKVTALDWISNFSKLGIAVYDKLYKMELFKDIRFQEGKIGEDFDVTYKVIEKAEKIIYSTEPKYYYRQRNGSYTRSGNVIFDNMYFTKEYMEMIIEKYPQIKDNAVKKYLFTCLNVYNQIVIKNKNREEKEKIMVEIKNMSKKINKKKLPKIKKYQLYLFLLNRKMYDFVLKCRNK